MNQVSKDQFTQPYGTQTYLALSPGLKPEAIVTPPSGKLKDYFTRPYGTLKQACFWMIFLFFLFFLSATYSQDTNAFTHQAEVYFEAGDMARARNQYELLEGLNLPPWQEAIIAYDIGTVLMAQGKWQEALSYFQKASSFRKRLPLLDYYLDKNIALAHLHLSQVNIEAIHTNSKVNAQDYVAMNMQLRELLEDIAESETSACRLAKAEGSKICLPSPSIDELKGHVKELLSSFLVNYFGYRNSHATIQDGIALLLAGVEMLIEHLHFLEIQSLPIELENKYLRVYFDEASSWIPLWDQLIKLFQAKVEQQQLFHEAHQEFMKGLELIKNARNKSLFSLEKSQHSLNVLLPLVFKDMPLKNSLQLIDINYALVLGQEPLQKISLLSVAKMQDAIGEKVTNSDNGDIQNSYQQAQNMLKHGIEVYDEVKPIQAAMFINVARHYILEMLHKSDKKLQVGAKDILKNILSLEELALTLNRGLSKAFQVEPISKTVEKLPKNIQSDALGLVKSFNEAALEQQKKEFNDKNRKIQPPWEEIFSLVREGQKAAVEANQQSLLFTSLLNIGLTESIHLQEKAVNKFKQALEKFQQGANIDEQQQERFHAEKATQHQQPQEKALDNILRTIQEMENDDRSKPRIKSTSNAEAEERPW